MNRVEPNSRFHTLDVYPGDMTVPGSPEYEYLPSESVLEPLSVPRKELFPATRVMTNEGPRSGAFGWIQLSRGAAP
jgi:hypothetical protein